MVVLADELLESFFETDLASSFRLEAAPGPQAQQAKAVLEWSLSTLVTDDNKKMFNKFSEKSVNHRKHQVSGPACVSGSQN